MISLDSVLAREYPDRTVIEVTPAPNGNRKATATVTFADGERVVVQRSARPDALRTEVALQRAIRERTAVSVPVVHRAGDGYAVVEYRAGADLHTRFVALSPAEQRAVAAAFGRALAELHEAFSFSGFGPLTESLDADEPWDAWFSAYARAGVDALPSAFVALREPIRDVFAACSPPKTPDARLYPWDLRPGNALYDGSVTFLDWGEPLVADPALAVAKAEHVVCDWYAEPLSDPNRANTLYDAFRAGYREIRALPDVPDAYRLLAVVRSAVDSASEITRPGYPERRGDEAVTFHRQRIKRVLWEHES